MSDRNLFGSIHTEFPCICGELHKISVSGLKNKHLKKLTIVHGHHSPDNKVNEKTIDFLREQNKIEKDISRVDFRLDL